MKLTKLFLAAALISIISFSCDVEYGDVLGSSNLPGTWTVTEMVQELYVDGMLEETNTETNLGTLSFDSEGEGTYSLTMEEETASGSFIWFEKNEKLFMNFVTLSEDVVTENLAVAWDVDMNSETTQKWSVTVTQYSDYEDEVTGMLTTDTEKTVIEVTLSKN